MTKMIRRGFTIVELLIVIVVIGILAAIVIVSYNGITNSAANSQIQANATELVHNLATYKIQNPNGEVYPAGTNNGGSIAGLQTAAKIPQNTNITAYLTSSDNTNYCATVTNGSTSYSVSSISTTPTSGSCVLNLATNPSVYGGSTYNWNSYAVSGTITSGSGLWAGSDVKYSVMAKCTTATCGAGGIYYGSPATSMPATPGTVYTASMMIKSNMAGSNFSFAIDWRNSAFQAISTSGGGYSISLSAGTAIQVNLTATAPVGAAFLQVHSYKNTWAQNDSMDYYNLLVTTGATTYQLFNSTDYAKYGNGGVIWTGTPGASPSILILSPQ